MTLDGRQEAPHSTYNFYVRRIFRIVPLYYVWLSIMVVWFWGISFASIRAFKLTFLLYALFGYNFVGGNQTGLVWASWTLGIAMLFYLAFPYIFRRVTSLPRAWIFLALTGLVSAAHYWLVTAYSEWAPGSGYTISISIFTYLPVFALGMVTYFLYRDYPASQRSPLFRAGVLGVGLVAFVGFPYITHAFNMPESYYFITIYGMAAVYSVLFLGISYYPASFLTNQVSIFFGLISYSLYLNHPVLVDFLSPVYQMIYATGGNTTLHYFECLLVTLVILTAISYATYRVIEQPFIALGRRFIKRERIQAS